MLSRYSALTPQKAERVGSITQPPGELAKNNTGRVVILFLVEAMALLLGGKAVELRVFYD